MIREEMVYPIQTINQHLLHILKYNNSNIILTGLISSVCSLLVAFFTSYILTHLFNINVAALAGLVLIFISSSGFNYINDYLLKNVNIALQAETLPRIWTHLLALPHRIISKYTSGDLSQRLYDYESALTQAATLITQLIFSFVGLLLISAFLLICEPKLTMIVMMISVTLQLVKLILIPANINHVNMGLRQKSMITQFLQETFLQIHKVRSSQSETLIQKRWLNQYLAMKRSAVKAAKIDVTTALIDAAIPLMFTLSIYSYLLVMPQRDTFVVLQFILTVTQFMLCTDKFFKQLTSFMMLLPRLKRLRPILCEPVELDVDSDHPLPPLAGTIEFKHVFVKQEDQPHYLLNDISFTVPAGKFVAIVGPSGSGKTTILKLLLGIISADSGEILIDQRPIQQYPQRQLRKQIAAVLQTSQLQSGSILNNLSAHRQLTHDEAWELIRIVGLEDDIKRFPMQLHTFISDNAGESLSGGQKQKILIARALAIHPRILLLDEATSALDNTSQQVIFNYLETVNITRLVIAHRYSTIANADMIYCISPTKSISPVTLSNITNMKG